MDRLIVYPGQLPQDTDVLNTNRQTMIALHGLLQAVLGASSANSGSPIAGTPVDGFTVTPTLPNSLQVVVGPGTITQLLSVDATPYGSLPADINDAAYKMGVMLAPQTLTVPVPVGSGTSAANLIEVSFNESDQNLVVLPYYNSSNPASPWSGPGNSGASQATFRRQSVTVQVKNGTPAPTGSQTTPAPDLGFVGVGVVTTTYGQTSIVAGNIAVPPLTRAVPWKLPDLTPGFTNSMLFTSFGIFTVPPQITRLRVTIQGGGGGGGGTNAANVGGGGGGSGSKIKVWVYNIYPASQLPVTVGAGGAGGASGAAGGAGGSSSFGLYATAGGGNGGGGGTGTTSGTGGAGGTGTVGTPVFYAPGSCGSNGIPGVASGGAGGGPGNGNGSNSGANGVAAPAYGGGGGGASGNGFTGGAGGGGYVVVEW